MSVPSLAERRSGGKPALARALDPHGGLLDSASPELASVRRRLVGARRAAADLLRDLAVRLRSHLQESFTTLRGGRPVLAVKASSRSAVPGIVHDSSGSGETIFVEPIALVEAGADPTDGAGLELASVAAWCAARPGHAQRCVYDIQRCFELKQDPGSVPHGGPPAFRVALIEGAIGAGRHHDRVLPAWLHPDGCNTGGRRFRRTDDQRQRPPAPARELNRRLSPFLRICHRAVRDFHHRPRCPARDFRL